MRKPSFGFSPLCSIATLVVLLIVVAMPAALAEKSDKGHVMHDYADMSWPFHGDTISVDSRTDKTKELAKKERQENKRNCKKEKAEQQQQKNARKTS